MAGIVQTGGIGVVRLKDEHPDVCPGTPIAIIGLFLKALRYRFERNEGEPLPWVWDSSLKPNSNTDEIPVPEGEPRKLMIEAAMNVEKSQRNYRPAIYIDRGDINPLKLHVDNRAGNQLCTGLKAFHSLANMPLTFEIEAENSGESSLIADTAWMFILASRDVFRQAFALHEITNPVLGRTTPKMLDKEVWVTPVTFSIQFDLRWVTRPMAPLLSDIAVSIRQEVEEGGDTNIYYHKIALRKLDT